MLPVFKPRCGRKLSLRTAEALCTSTHKALAITIIKMPIKAQLKINFVLYNKFLFFNNYCAIVLRAYL